MKPENIIKFSEWSNKPEGTAFKRVVLKHNEQKFRGGHVIKWDSYDVTMLVIRDGEFHIMEWNYAKGRITTNPISFTTSEIDYICEEFVETDMDGILDAFDLFFYDSREARLTSEEEVKQVAKEWREEHTDRVKEILKINETEKEECEY